MLSYKHTVGPVPASDTTLYSVFEAARSNNDNTEFYFMETDERVFLTDVWGKVDAYAKGMLSLGVQRGETLTAMGLVSAETLYIAAAAISIGVGYSHPYVYDPIEKSLPYFIQLVEPSLLVVGEGFGGEVVDRIVSILAEQPDQLSCIKQILYDNTQKGRSITCDKLKLTTDLVTLGEEISDEELRTARASVQSTDPCMHLFTSGSTGKSKCVVHTHYGITNELLCQVPKGLGALMTTSNNMDELCSYACLTIGLAGYTSKVVMGAAVPEEDPERVVKRMAEAVTSENVHHLVLTSAFVSSFVKYGKTGEYTFPSVQTVLLSGQIFSQKFRNDIIKYIDAIPWTLYGMSEVMNISKVAMDESSLSQVQRSGGKMLPLNNVVVKLVNDEGETVPTGEQGQLLLKKYSILSEYKNSDPAVRKQLLTDDGFVKSGDMAVMDEHGAIELKGRHVDAVRFKVFAEVVYPGPIEQCLAELPAVREAQVVSVSGTDFIGDEIVYCLCLESGHEKLSEDVIIDHVVEKLDEMKKPCRIVYFDKFPRTSNSRKVSKSKIREQIRQWILQDTDYGATQWFSAIRKAIDSETNVYQ